MYFMQAWQGLGGWTVPPPASRCAILRAQLTSRELPLLALLRLKLNHRFSSAVGGKADLFCVYVCFEGHNGTNLGPPFSSGFDPGCVKT